MLLLAPPFAVEVGGRAQLLLARERVYISVVDVPVLPARDLDPAISTTNKFDYVK